MFPLTEATHLWINPSKPRLQSRTNKCLVMPPRCFVVVAFLSFHSGLVTFQFNQRQQQQLFQGDDPDGGGGGVATFENTREVSSFNGSTAEGERARGC